jgi:hypothetical protein
MLIINDININNIRACKNFLLNIENFNIKNQGKSNMCSLFTIVNAIEFLLKNNNNHKLSIFNLYLKSHLCANKLNPNNKNNYRIINSSCSLNNYGQNDGFSLKNTIYGGISGICYDNKWINIPSYVSYLPNFTFPFKNLNPLLIQDYIYNRYNHVHIKKFIKIVPIITDNIIITIKEIELIENIFDQNNLFMPEVFYKLKNTIFEDDNNIDDYQYTNQNKQYLINSIKKLLNITNKPILISLILPSDTENMLDKTYCVIESNNNCYDDFYLCLIIGYTKTKIKILTSWGSDFGENGCFYININYLFEKSDGKQLNLDLNQIYIITEVE